MPSWSNTIRDSVNKSNMSIVHNIVAWFKAVVLVLPCFFPIMILIDVFSDGVIVKLYADDVKLYYSCIKIK